MLTLTPPVTHYLAEAFVNTTGSTLEHDYLVGIADAVRDFSLGNDQAAVPVGRDYRNALTPDAVAHLLDVRTVFIGLELAALIASLLVIGTLTISIRRYGLRSIALPLLIAGLAPLTVALLLGLAVLIDFAGFFAFLHSLFFVADSWVFPADSLLIRALPEAFWLGCAIVWLVFLVILCALCILVGLLIRRRSQASVSQKT
ncbi:MAG: DUF1461 domain-containing protein [Coriobacteriales bacterium]|jgi:integral membrane protein (TIGR01906 family)|nr:DUF1461 domain-containing protein [Coriobacteriales bacterium]